MDEDKIKQKNELLGKIRILEWDKGLNQINPALGRRLKEYQKALEELEGLDG